MKLITQAMVIALLLSGCATTNPGSGASTKYYLPKTIVKADLTLILKGCTNNPNGHATIEVEPKLNVSLIPSNDGVARVIHGQHLGSDRTKRQLTVTTHPSGLIAGINTTNQDQTAAIISNVASFATKVLSVAALADSTTPADKIRFECHPDVSKHLNSIANLKDNIKDQQQILRAVNFPSSPKKIQEDIDALAVEISKIRTSSPMSLTFSKNIPIEQVSLLDDPKDEYLEQELEFDFADVFEKWLIKSELNGIEKEKSAEYNFAKKHLRINWAGKKSRQTNATISSSDKSVDFKACELSILVPPLTHIDLQITPKGSLYDDKLTESTQSIPAPQLSDPEKLCLSVAFAENRTVNMSFNKFGQRTSFTWNSEARAEAVTGALAGIAKDVSTTMSSLEGQSELDKQLETINQVNTQIQYNNALLCQQAAAEGATSCPAPDGN
ncbi:hypothetical protein [Marinicella meishanensis]|uniref:hypothetical protein n=1 Tax=Marinicella meishanensis TaxID=2873263 RepID=UPI001CC0BAAC|nr:hypothetical protein [Marinicella sp. NBU2979]